MLPSIELSHPWCKPPRPCSMSCCNPVPAAAGKTCWAVLGAYAVLLGPVLSMEPAQPGKEGKAPRAQSPPFLPPAGKNPAQGARIGVGVFVLPSACQCLEVAWPHGWWGGENHLTAGQTRAGGGFWASQGKPPRGWDFFHVGRYQAWRMARMGDSFPSPHSGSVSPAGLSWEVAGAMLIDQGSGPGLWSLLLHPLHCPAGLTRAGRTRLGRKHCCLSSLIAGEGTAPSSDGADSMAEVNPPAL